MGVAGNLINLRTISAGGIGYKCEFYSKRQIKCFTINEVDINDRLELSGICMFTTLYINVLAR